MPSITVGIVLLSVHLFEGTFGQQGAGFKTDVHVEEHGIQYNQTVEYDPVTTAVTITVPKHLNIDASTVILHKPSNTQMLLDPVRGYCQLKKVPDHFDPQDMILSSFSMAANRKVLTPEMAKEVQLIQVTQGKLSLAKRKQLLKSVQDLCQDLPIFLVEEIDVTDAVYENGFVSLNDTHANDRRKRRFGVTCDNLANRCTKEHPDGAQYCQWFVTCTTKNPSERCKAEHLRSDHGWSCLICCNDGPKWEMCDCNDVNDADTFVYCQGRNTNS